MKRKKTLEDLDIAGKTALVRVDFNVPFHPGTTEVADDGRIRATLPTITYLKRQGCRMVLCSHLGRPRGRVVEELRMAPVTRRLSELLGEEVPQAPDCVGPEVEELVGALKPGQALMLENLRFHPEEERNDPAFARQLASLGQVFVNDAFGAAHRAHASTVGVAAYLPAVAGFLMARELEQLGRVLEDPARPFVAILGGAKVSDKLAVMENLAPRVDALLVGGGMVATFLRAQGLTVGASPVDEDHLEGLRAFIRKCREEGPRLVLPVDVVVAQEFSASTPYRRVNVHHIPDTWRIMDVGSRTTTLFAEELRKARTVLWNGPMGVFEWEPFSHGTAAVAQTLAELEDAVTVVGGGSTAEAVAELGLTDRMTHVSTGGGACLEFLEGRELPGVAALLDAE